MNSRQLSTWLLGGLFLLAGASCKHTEDEPVPDEVTTVSYAQTQCADKWGFTRDNQKLETMATVYLLQQGIVFANAHATQVNSGAVCNACTCPTGVVLTGTVSLSQLAAIQALGFKKL